MNAQLIVVKLNTIGRLGNEFHGPFDVGRPVDIRPTIQEKFNTLLKGIAGYVLVYFDGKLWQCERNQVDPSKPYVRTEIAYHPLANKFTSQSARPVDVGV